MLLDTMAVSYTRVPAASLLALTCYDGIEKLFGPDAATRVTHERR